MGKSVPGILGFELKRLSVIHPKKGEDSCHQSGIFEEDKTWDWNVKEGDEEIAEDSKGRELSTNP